MCGHSWRRSVPRPRGWPARRASCDSGSSAPRMRRGARPPGRHPRSRGALGVRGFRGMLHGRAGPAVGDVRALVATIRAEAEGLAGTSRELRQRIVSAADAAEARLAELDAVFEVVQEEVEATVLDVAATMRSVRRGISLLEWGRRTLKRRKKP